jgi:hypothetical protein
MKTYHHPFFHVHFFQHITLLFHGCSQQLVTLLVALGYEMRYCFKEEDNLESDNDEIWNEDNKDAND